MLILDHLLNFVFPQICISCQKTGEIFCTQCLANTPEASPCEYSFISALYNYKNPNIRDTIWRLKYKNVRNSAKLFGEKLYEKIIGDLGDDIYFSKHETLLLVPIPLHKKRQHERGYNQSELIARAIKQYDIENIFMLSINSLVRKKETRAQAQSEKRNTRFENLRGAFDANKEIVTGKHIILIDDVTTTGATLAEARKALLKAGAHSVRAYTIAH